MRCRKGTLPGGMEPRVGRDNFNIIAPSLLIVRAMSFALAKWFCAFIHTVPGAILDRVKETKHSSDRERRGIPKTLGAEEAVRSASFRASLF